MKNFALFFAVTSLALVGFASSASADELGCGQSVVTSSPVEVEQDTESGSGCEDPISESDLIFQDDNLFANDTDSGGAIEELESGELISDAGITTEINLPNVLPSYSLLQIGSELERQIIAGGLQGGVGRTADGSKVLLWASVESVSYLKSQVSDDDFWNLIEIEFLESPASLQLETWSGGMSLGGICTGGYPGYLGTETGLITALHCVIDPATGSDLAIAYQGEIFQSRYIPTDETDIIFVGLEAPPSGLVRVGSGLYKVVGSQSNPRVGSVACHWGLGSGYSCATVSAVHSFFQVSPTRMIKNVAFLSGGTSAPGDSGGPWFRQGSDPLVALGIHLGTLTTSAFTYRVMTLVSSATTLLGASVLLTGLT